MRRGLLLLLFLIASVVPAELRAASVIEAASGAGVTVSVGEGRLLRLDRPVASVFIANPEVADVQVQSPRTVYVLGKRTGRTSLFALDEEEEVIFGGQVEVTHDLAGLRRALDTMGDTRNVTLESIDGGLILSGAVESAEAAENLRRVAARYAGDAEEIINRVRVDGPNQINLRVRVAEVSRRLVKQLGIRWAALFSPGNFNFGLVGGTSIATGGAFTGGVGATGSNFDINFFIDALADEGLLTVLAEPNLTALSGEEASFLAGGEFPIPVAQSQDTITVEYKRFGVSLSFRPVLLSGGRISLHVAPEVSELAPQEGVLLEGLQVPGLTTRRADTTVELGSGQSFAIAGLLSNRAQHDNSRLPGLGDLPVLGSLFRSTRFQRGETELVIIVTPYIVQPAQNERQFAQPTDGFAPPDDVRRLLFGQIYATDANYRTLVDSRLGDRRLRGSVGFTLE